MANKKGVKATVLPSKEKIKKLKGDFELKLKTIREENKSNRVSPKRAFLRELQESITKAVKDGCTLNEMKQAIKEIYNVDVSIQLVSSFIKEEIKVVKRTKRATKKVSDEACLKSTPKTTSKTSSQIKEELANKDNEDDEEVSL